MFRSPDHFHNLSLRLSEVLDDGGVNERTVMKRRRTYLLNETNLNLYDHLMYDVSSFYIFGSQTEGATTFDQISDTDILTCDHSIRVIQNWSEWEAGHEMQLLMIRDETTSPGYCLLQLVRNDVPLPAERFSHKYFARDNKGRVLVKHYLSFMCILLTGFSNTQHGPAIVLQRSEQGGCDVDQVCALGCDKWPIEGNQWLQQENVSKWPTVDLKRCSMKHGCFVVPLASRTGMYPDLEWRISTSYAERCLMFSLNITQIRCYILMKMIIKTFIKPKNDDAISSFMCKNVLFRCMADSTYEWKDTNLVTCLKRCLELLLNFVLTENCPHFIMPNINLLFRKLSMAVKKQVLDALIRVTEDIEASLLGIHIDDLGGRLAAISSGIPHTQPNGTETRIDMQFRLSVYLNITSVQMVSQGARRLHEIQSKEMIPAFHKILVLNMAKLVSLYIYSDSCLLKSAICQLMPFECISLGCIAGSKDIQQSRNLTPEAVLWFYLGLNTDFASGRLKLAATLYRTGALEKCEVVLDDLERKFETNSFCAMCACYLHDTCITTEFERLCKGSDDHEIRSRVALCTAFSSREINCAPIELKYEMFRSTKEELLNRRPFDIWMEWAVVDSQPFLYFLQFKVYSQLRKHTDKSRAVLNLVNTIQSAENLCHKETALNLLGQCMRQENLKDIALLCYIESLKVRPRNNVASWHICALLAASFRAPGVKSARTP